MEQNKEMLNDSEKKKQIVMAKYPDAYVRTWGGATSIYSNQSLMGSILLGNATAEAEAWADAAAKLKEQK